jgi:hypothetical protein
MGRYVLTDDEALSVDAADQTMTRRRYRVAARLLRKLARYVDHTPLAELPSSVGSFLAWLEDSLDAQEVM